MNRVACACFVRVCLCTLSCVYPNVCVCVASNPELLCGDSRYNICKPLPLCWISNGLKTSPLSVATLLQLGLCIPCLTLPPRYTGVALCLCVCVCRLSHNTPSPSRPLMYLPHTKVVMRKADRAETDTFISLTAANVAAFLSSFSHISPYRRRRRGERRVWRHWEHPIMPRKTGEKGGHGGDR